MAEVDMTYSAEQVEQLLRCPVCLDRFTNPKILPCQHTFCKEPCLEGLCDMRTRKVKCPECRKEHYVPYSGPAGFPTNITVSNFLDLPAQPSARNEQPASNQEQEPPQEEPQPPATAAGSTSQCGVCEKEEETIKCFHCNKMVCQACKQSHTGQMKLDVGRLVNQIRRGVPSLSNSISSVEQKSEQVKQQVETTRSEIRDTIQRYIKELKDREKQLCSETGTFLQGEMRSLRLHQENLEVELASISSYCDSMDTLLNTADNNIPEADMVSMKKQCGEYMEQIRATVTNPLLETRDCAFDFDGHVLSGSIASFGQVNMSNPPSARGDTPPPAHEVPAPAVNSQQSRRARWSDRQPVDASLFRNLPASAVTPSPRTINPSPAQARTTRSSLEPSRTPQDYTAPDYTLPSRREDYLMRMDTSTDNILDSMDYFRRQLEVEPAPRRGNNTTSMFGPDPFPHRRRPMSEDDRVSGLFGGGGGGVGVSVADGNTLGRRARGRGARRARGNSQRSQNPWRNPPTLDRSWRTDISTTQNTRSQSQQNTAQPNPALYHHRREYDPRPPVAFDVTLDGEEGVVSSAGRQDRRNRVSNNPRNGGQYNGTSNTTGNTRNAAPNEANRTSNSQREGNQSSATPNSNTNQNGHNQPVPSSSNAPPNAARGVGASGNQNGNASSQEATTSETDMDLSPVPIQRSHTFVQEVPSNPSNLPVVDGNGTTFDVALDGSAANEASTSNRGSNNRGANPNDSISVRLPIFNYKQKGRPTKTIGNGRGRDQGQFTWPRGVAVSPVNDSVLVADSSNHRVQIFDCHGHFVNSFGSYGHAEGEFDCLAGVAVNSDGDIVIADRYNHRIQVFDRYGTFKRVFGREGSGNGQLNYPWGVSIGPDGLIYVCDKENHRVQVFKPDGKFVRKIGGLGVEAGKLENPHYCAISPDNKVIVSDCNNHRIQIFSNTGRYITSFCTGGSAVGNLKNPKGIVVDPQGFIIVADSGNNRIQVFRGDGQFFSTFGSWGSGSGQFKGIEGIALTSSGNIIVSDKENHRIQIF